MQCTCAIFSSVDCPAGQYFSMLSHKRHDLKKKSLNIKYVFQVSLQLLSGIFFIIIKTERDVMENVYWSLCEVPFILVRF